MASRNSAGLIFGALLVAVGGVLMATRYFSFRHSVLWTLGLGLAFAVIAIVGRSYAALVAGMVLLGVGAGLLLEGRGQFGLPADGWRPVCLGLAFIGIYVLSLLLKLKSHWWPLVPGVVLITYGGVGWLGRLPLHLTEFVMTWWPVALILIGAALIIKAARS